MEGGAARFSLQQAVSAYVETFVMSCRGGCKPPGSQLQYYLVGLGQQILSPCSVLSLAHKGAEQSSPSVFHSTSLSLQRQEAPLELAQQNVFQCRTRQLPQARTTDLLLPLGHQPLSERQGECCIAIGTE